MVECVKWGERGARLNAAADIIVTLLAVDEFNGPGGEFYKNMFANCPAGRPETADEVEAASYSYGPLRPETQKYKEKTVMRQPCSMSRMYDS